MDDILENLLQEEKELQFNSFNEETAWDIGNKLVERAIQDELPITIDITRGEHQLFHASRPGTSADNDEWVKLYASLTVHECLKAIKEDAWFTP